MFKIEFVKQENLITERIYGRIYVNSDCTIPNGLQSNPGVIAYYPEDWIELYLKLGRCKIINPEILEKCLATSTDAEM